MMQSRIEKFQKILKGKGLNGFIVTNPINIFYLCGFRGISQTERESFLVVDTKKSAVLIAPRLYQKEANERKSKDLKVKIARERNELFPSIGKLIGGKKKIGFEQNDLKYGEYQELTGPRSDLKLGSSLAKGPTFFPTFLPFENLVESMRMLKTSEEIKKIERAQLISQKAFEQIVKTIKVGQTEEEIADTLAKIIKSLGGQDLAFESIIASGPNSGIPHHVTSARRLTTGDILLFDFGTKFQNYHADLSRTIFIGKAKTQHANIYRHVQRAQRQAMTKIRHGVKLAEAYGFANRHFENLKLDKFFLHGLGHGIGLEIHEEPYLRKSPGSTSFRKENPLDPISGTLQENMVFSVEPGLYFPWGGVRIEDLVVIENGKAKVLGKMQDEVIEI